MKKLVWALLCVASISYGQIVFEPGYYLDQQHQKHEGLIRNEGWLNNPSEIVFKESETSEARKIPKSDITQFEVGDLLFIKFEMQVDVSDNNLNTMTTTASPVWEKRTELIRKIADGPYSLYVFRSSNLNRFFYSNQPHTEVTQLVYKKFRTAQSSVNENNFFRNQLLELFSNQGLSEEQSKKIDYDEDDLVETFVQFGSTAIVSPSASSGSKFHLTVSGGAMFWQYVFKDPGRNVQHNFSGTSILPQVEIEYVLEFNRNKWSIFTGVGYMKLSGETGETNFLTGEAGKTSFDFTNILLPIGIRYRMFLNEFSKVSLDAGTTFVAGSGEVIRPLYLYETKNNPRFFVGAGFTFKKIGASVRYHLPTETLGNRAQSGQISSMECSLRYTIF